MKNRIKIKLTAITLVICMLLSGSLMPISAVTELDRSPKVQEELSGAIESIPAEDMALEQVDLLAKEDEALWKFIDRESPSAEKHTARLAALEEPDTFVFQNSDGTRTVYFMEEDVKYVDSNGSTVIKDISLTKANNGFGIVRNEVDLLIPDKLTSGVDISLADYSVKLIPQNTATNILPEQKNNSVVYNGVFGEKTALVYTPVLSGIKEDIVLSEYTENASYTFVLKTNGLLLCNRDGKYVLCNGLQKDPVFYLGEILVYDAIGKPDMGSMTVETIEEGQEYLLTVTASDEFLSDPDTVYPVTIDPSISSSDSTTSGAIEDAVIFQNRPNDNFGTYVYNRVGTPSASYGVGRTVVRLRELLDSDEWAELHPYNVESLYFYATEATGSGSQTIMIYPLFNNTTWTESTVTWNEIGANVGWYMSFNATMRYNEEAMFDLTSLVTAWMYGDIPQEAGFIMLNSNESLDKSFCSSEYSNSSMRPRVVMTYTPMEGGDSFANATSLTSSDYVTAKLRSATDKRYFKFVPSTTGFYTIESRENTADPYVKLYNSTGHHIFSDYDSAGYSNFRMTHHLVKDATYYFEIGCSITGAGLFTFTFSSTNNASYIGASTVYFGQSYYVNNMAPYQSTVFQFTPAQSREYLFYSTSPGSDPKVWLYNSNLSLMSQNDNSAGNGEFELVLNLVAGQTYYIVVGHSSSNYGECALYVNYNPSYANRILSYVNYYDSSFAADPTLINNIALANEFSDLVYSYFGIKMNIDGEPTQNANILDSCTTGLNEPCDNEICGTPCSQHHKNVLRISDELYYSPREDDHLYVLWTNRAENTYCIDESYFFQHALQSASGMVYSYRPVIHMMRISGENDVQRLAVMSMVLAHETAHTFGMDDLLYHQAGAPLCIMSYSNPASLTALYYAIWDDGAQPFCDSCMDSMEALIQDLSIEGNQ